MSSRVKTTQNLLPSLADVIHRDPAARHNVGMWNGVFGSSRCVDMAMSDAYSALRLQAVTASRQKVLDAVLRALGTALAHGGQVARSKVFDWSHLFVPKGQISVACYVQMVPVPTRRCFGA